MDGHQLDAAIAAGFRVGLRGEGFEGGVERGAEEVLLAVGEAVETLPEEVEVDACGGVDALSAAETEPDLLEPGAERAVGWAKRRAGATERTSRTRSAAWRPSLLRSERRSASSSGMGRASSSGSSALVRVCRSASERPHQGARRTPSQATRSRGLSRARAEGESVEDFRAGGELFEVDGAEGDVGCAEGLGDGGESVAGAAEDGDAVVFAR